MTPKPLRTLLLCLLLAVAFAVVHVVAPAAAATKDEAPYLMGQGDKVRVTVFDEPDLSGDFLVDERGMVSLPLIGEVELGGLDLRGGERLIEQRLLDGYLKKPRVNLQVLNYRPFYILGEVNDPGQYEYRSGMTILTAVALAGGFTYRANKDDFLIVRATDPARKEVEVSIDTTVLPGDVVKVKERFF